VLAPSKAKWEEALLGYLGEDYAMVASFALGGTHLAVFAHISVTPIISNVESECVATGINNTVGNKGGVAVRFNVGKTSVLCICSHLAAG
jgi:phosphatidylinositol-bisphosphatase